MSATVEHRPTIVISEVVDNSRDVFHAFQIFCGKFETFIQEGKYKEAQDLLLSEGRPFATTFAETSTFDTMLERIVKEKRDANRYDRASRLCTILANCGYTTDFSRVCLPSCQIKLGNLIDAKDELRKQNYPQGIVSSWLQDHMHIKFQHEEEFALLIRCEEFMDEAIVIDRFCEGFQKLLAGKDYIGALALFGENKKLFPTFKALRCFDTMLETFAKDADVDTRQLVILLCLYFNKVGIASDKSQNCYEFCIAAEHEEITARDEEQWKSAVDHGV